MSRVRFAAVGCSHSPLQSEEAVEWACEQIREHKPHYLIHTGDTHEADSASRWPTEYDWDLEHEYIANNRVLNMLRTAALAGIKSARCILIEGNHDANILELGRLDPKIRSLCDWRRPQYDDRGTLLNEELVRYWKNPTAYIYDRNQAVFRLGQVAFFHGFNCSDIGIFKQNIQFGDPFGLTVSGHTHRPHPPEQLRGRGKVLIPYWHANVGTLGPLKPPFMRRLDTEAWGHGIVLGSCNTDPHPKHFRDWEAETRIYSAPS